MVHRDVYRIRKTRSQRREHFDLSIVRDGGPKRSTYFPSRKYFTDLIQVVLIFVYRSCVLDINRVINKLDHRPTERKGPNG